MASRQEIRDTIKHRRIQYVEQNRRASEDFINNAMGLLERRRYRKDLVSYCGGGPESVGVAQSLVRVALASIPS